MILNPWVILGIVAAWIATVVGSALYYADLRVEAALSAVKTEQAAELAAAHKLKDEANAKTKVVEQKAADDQAAIGASYDQRIEEINDQHARDVAAARAGSLRLRDPGARPQACPGVVPDAAPAAAGRDAQAAGQLSIDAEEFLLGEARRADATTEQLRACQAVVAGDRQAINGRYP